METTTRNASLRDLVDLLVEQQARKVDFVAPAVKIRAESGQLLVEGVDAIIEDDGVTAVDGIYSPTQACDGDLADKLGIPAAYLKRLRAERIDLYDANVNGWLSGYRTPQGVEWHEPDARRFLVRCFRPDSMSLPGTQPGIARAVLSDGFRIIDHLDSLTTVLEAVKEGGIDAKVTQCDLTDRNMYVKLEAPEVYALAPQFLARYRSPFDGRPGSELPIINAGLVLRNSETGDGAWSLAPQLTVQVCRNGMTRREDALRAVHVGSKMDEGLIRWSVEAQEANLTLIKAQTRDAVRTFLDVEYVEAVIEQIEAKAGRSITKPDEAVQTVCKRLGYSEDRMNSVLGMFIAGADLTAGGVMQAVTAAAQQEADADVAADMEADAFRALDYAAAL